MIVSRYKMVKLLFYGFWRGFAQVMFQSHVWSGVLFAAGIALGAIAMGQLLILAGAVVGCIGSTIAGLVWGNKDDVPEGLYGYNGVLVGCAVSLFLPAVWWMWVLLVAGSVLTVFLRDFINRCGVNPLTIPFVLITWIILFLWRLFCPAVGTDSLIPCEMTAVTLISGVIKGISEVFLVDSVATGLLFIAALALGNHRATAWAIIGSVIGLIVAWVFGADNVTVTSGLWSFSPALTAVALGSVFGKFSLRTVGITVVSTAFTVVVQYILSVCLLPLSLPVLTAPFCIATLIFKPMLSS